MKIALFLAAVASVALAVPSHTIIVDDLDNFSTNSSTTMSLCPDGKSTCAKGSTCCEMKSGKFGCCHFEHAVCCPDGLNCCPVGSTCNMKTKSCDVKINERFYLVEENPSEIVPLEEGKVGCPTPSPCLKDQTCCTLSSKEIGCCPYKNGICCPDGDFCCPAQTTCNAQSTRCDYNGTEASFSFEPIPGMVEMSVIEEEEEVDYDAFEDHSNICDDPEVKCQEGATCCKLTGGEYGCCPYDNAVCCKDGAHCCPSGMTCDLEHGRCQPHIYEPFYHLNLKSNELVEVVPKAKAWFTEIIEDGTTCDDPSVKCEAGQTCCKLQSGGFGCCPYKNAVCCKDGAHCCPSGMNCDLTHGRCTRHSLFAFFPMLESSYEGKWAKLDKILGDHIQCPNPEDQCLRGQTCCLIADFEYGCCHFANAVCCADRMHCCPEDTICDMTKNACLPKNNTRVLTQPVEIAFRTCPPGYNECGNGCCPSGRACCAKFNKCCPLEDMICCDDGEHCCPSNMICNVFNNATTSTNVKEVCLLP